MSSQVFKVSIKLMNRINLKAQLPGYDFAVASSAALRYQ